MPIKTKKIVFLGTKPIGAHCLTYLLQHQKEFDIAIVAIGTQDRKEFSNTNPIEMLAVENDIPLIDHPDAIPNCDIIYSVQYHKILKQAHIDKAHDIAVNLHLAPLPDYRGCNQFSFAIYNGAKVFGVTIHEINTGVDSGAILFENRFEMPEGIWVKDLFDMSVEKGKLLFETTFLDLLQGNYTRMSQADLVASRGVQVYQRKDINSLKEIRLDESSEKIKRRIRATYMPGFEPPFFAVGQQKIYIQVADD